MTASQFRTACPPSDAVDGQTGRVPAALPTPCARRPCSSPRRCRPRTARCSRCPTRARSSGTSRTRPGSSRPSSSSASARLRAVPSAVPGALQLLLQRGRRRHPRPRARPALAPDAGRGSSPTARTSSAMLAPLLARADGDAELAALVELGLHHEQQHQELILTDVKHLLSRNPLRPPTCERWPLTPVAAAPLRRGSASPADWSAIGHDGARLRLRQRVAAAPRLPRARSSSPRTR